MKKIILTKHELWMQQAPAFNFELDEESLLKTAIDRGFVTEISDDQYEVNTEYKGNGA